MTKTILAVLALVTLCTTGASARSDKSKVVQRALRQSVRVEVLVRGKVARSASGVIVASDAKAAYVLTNEHVVEREGLAAGASIEVIVERPKLHRLAAHVVQEGHVPEEDLALLSIPGDALEAVEVAAQDQVDVGDDVVVIGAPYGRALSVSSGIVSQLDPDDAERPMKTDAPIGYGASGGGVFDLAGRLVGLVEGYRTAKVSFSGIARDEFSFDVPMPGETFLAPPFKLRAFLGRSGLTPFARFRREGRILPALAAPVARAR